MTDQKPLWENGKGLRMMYDYIYGNYGDIESQIEDIKLKIMVSEKRKS